MSVELDVDQYCNYWEEQISSLRQLKNRLYQKILIVTMLDCWSRGVLPEEARNAERFKRFVREFSGWEESNRVNQSHLLFLLDSNLVGGASRLRTEIAPRVAGWPDGKVVSPEDDPALEDLLLLARPEEVKHLESSTHLALLYVYRNHLVHEFREPGHAVELSAAHKRPFYHGMMGELADTWELAYPLGFFLDIASESLGRLRHHFLEKEISPYASYSFGSPWRR